MMARQMKNPADEELELRESFKVAQFRKLNLIMINQWSVYAIIAGLYIVDTKQNI